MISVGLDVLCIKEGLLLSHCDGWLLALAGLLSCTARDKPSNAEVQNAVANRFIKPNPEYIRKSRWLYWGDLAFAQFFYFHDDVMLFVLFFDCIDSVSFDSVVVCQAVMFMRCH